MLLRNIKEMTDFWGIGSRTKKTLNSRDYVNLDIK